VPDEAPKGRWTSYSSKTDEETPPNDEISYAEAKEYQQMEFGPLDHPDNAAPRAQRLNRREGYSPTEDDKWRVGGALASSLGLTEAQMNEVYSIMSELNLAAFGSQRCIETVSLGVIAVVVNYDRFQRRQNPDATRIVETSEFRELMVDLDIDYSDIGTAKRVVKQELNGQGYFGQVD
jgi:hypothetical protein